MLKVLVVSVFFIHQSFLYDSSFRWVESRETTSATNFLLNISPITSRVSVNVELTGSIQNFLGN